MNKNLKKKLDLINKLKNNNFKNNKINNNKKVKQNIKVKPINKKKIKNNIIMENKDIVLNKKKIALCFWGLTRSLRRTHTNIKEKILKVLENNNFEYTIFMHTFKLDKINAKRSNENNIDLEFDEYKLLNPDYFEYDKQNEILNKLKVKQYRSKPDHWRTNYQNTDFFILSMYSKMRVTELVKKSELDFNYVVFLRPDINYLHNFPINLLDKINDNTCLIPNFHLDKGVNDRFYISNKDNALKFGYSFEHLLDYSKKKILNSEHFCRFILDKYKIKFININFKFQRVRANLKIHPRDKRDLKI